MSCDDALLDNLRFPVTVQLTPNVNGIDVVLVKVTGISNESPVGMAILHHHAGEVVEVQVPAGMLRYEIVEIK